VPVYFPDVTFAYEVYEDVFMNGEIRLFKNRKVFVHEIPTNLLPPPHCLTPGTKRCWFPVGRVMWNVSHPEDIAMPWEQVHHDNNDKLNNCPHNLIKMHKKDHKKLHKMHTPTGAWTSTISNAIREFIMEQVDLFGKHKVVFELLRERFPNSYPSRSVFKKILRKERRKRTIELKLAG
jgi:hypothetical protein